MFATIAALALMALKPTELTDYLQKPDPSYTWSVQEKGDFRTTLRLVSQTWQGIPWEHSLVVIKPRKPYSTELAILVLTGGEPNERELTQLALVAELTGVPTAVLFQIPKQPLFGDLIEDDLIAHTFEKYLETGDASWPLLFPMTKSALRGMDAVQEFTKDWEEPVQKFLVTGASKRGWTTWMVGASGDPRIAGLAPLVIDNLNIPAQMKHQKELWDGYSPQIDDYTRRGLQQKLETPEGLRLAQMIDPYSYRERITAPTMIINAGNDAYWTVDALNHYWNDLKQPKWVRMVPNVPHSLGDLRAVIENVGMFARSLCGEFRMPVPSWEYLEGPRLRVATKGHGFEKVSLWRATSDDLRFDKSTWEVIQEQTFSPESIETTISYSVPENQNSAVFCEMRYRVHGRLFSLTTSVRIHRKQTP